MSYESKSKDGPVQGKPNQSAAVKRRDCYNIPEHLPD
jgi:hypothetical protein